MTRRLLLIRHAKSDWSDDALADHERPLAKRGHRAAELVAAHLRAEGLRPDLVLCSPSRRTRETFERLGLEDVAVRFEEDLYGATAPELLGILRAQDPGAGTVAVIGHNPGLQDLAILLVGRHEGALETRVRERFPTGAVAAFDVDEAWSDLAARRVRLTSFVVPKDLG